MVQKFLYAFLGKNLCFSVGIGGFSVAAEVFRIVFKDGGEFADLAEGGIFMRLWR